LLRAEYGAALIKWRDSGRRIPDGGGPIPTREDLEDLEG
jgi:hypothetical protein